MARKQNNSLVRAIEDALAPGGFIDYREMFAFTERLELVRSKLEALITQGLATQAVALYEAFIAGCYEKSEEIDDSGGEFGSFVSELFCDWVKARQAAKAPPEETVEMLLSWMDDDDYGYLYSIEEQLVKALDRSARTALERAVRARMAAAEKESYGYRHAAGLLKAVLVGRQDVESYANLCDQAGELTPEDCEVLAGLCLKRRNPQDALGWVERGLKLRKKEKWQNQGGWRLDELQRQILGKLGRPEDARQLAWQAYCESPSIDSYEELMNYVPKPDRADWHARAIGKAKGAGLSAAINVFTGTREWDRLAELIEKTSRKELMRLSHYTSEPAAKKLERTHPLAGAKLYLVLGLRILEAKKSKYYAEALDNLEKARTVLLKQKRAGEWEDVVSQVREKHSRKFGFMPAFERLVKAQVTKPGPSFLDRARSKWARKVRTS